MEAIERVLAVPDWMIVVLLFSFFLLILLKNLNAEKFVGNLTSINNKGFLEIESEEKQPLFTGFSFLFTFFSLMTISLVIYLSISEIKQKEFILLDYTQVFILVLIYMLARFLLENLLVTLFSVTHVLSFFFQSKRTYLFSISVGLWLFLVFYLFTFQDILTLWVGCSLLFAIRLIAILTTNKNLIFSNLFYFILYLCTFEIAPLLILYKLITK